MAESESGSCADWHRIDGSDGTHVLMVRSSSLFSVDAEAGDRLRARDEDAIRALDALATTPPAPRDDPQDPQAISLNVAAGCNLSCGYCYASRGGFEGAQRGVMSWETARASIDALFARCDRRRRVTVGFLGGEPFVQSRLIEKCVQYAERRGCALGLDVGFSVTTNGTLLGRAEVELLRSRPFAVTVSIDGGKAIQERQRPGASFEALSEAIAPLLRDPGRAGISARATVDRSAIDLTARFDDLRGLGFSEIGFSPVRVGSVLALRDSDWTRYSEEMRTLARREVESLRKGEATAFSNLRVALQQIHAGSAAQRACGAGAGYFSVATDGGWFACHRAIGEDEYRLGDDRRLDSEARDRFLADRTVDRSTDCQRCWARYLCSGGCHQEREARSVASCDFIREWLEFCLDAYASLADADPSCAFIGGHHA